MVTKKKAVLEQPKEPIVIITDKETAYRFNWIMVRRKIIAFTQLFRFKPKATKEISMPPVVEEIKPKRVRKPRIKKEVKDNV